MGLIPLTLPEGIALEMAAVVSRSPTLPDALPALLPVGLGDRGGEINQIFRNAFDRIVLDGEDIDTVLAEEGRQSASSDGRNWRTLLGSRCPQRRPLSGEITT